MTGIQDKKGICVTSAKALALGYTAPSGRFVGLWENHHGQADWDYRYHPDVISFLT